MTSPPAEVVEDSKFVLVVSPQVFFKLSCWSSEHTAGKLSAGDLVLRCVGLTLPVEDMVLGMVQLEVDVLSRGLRNAWRKISVEAWQKQSAEVEKR